MQGKSNRLREIYRLWYDDKSTVREKGSDKSNRVIYRYYIV